MFEAFGLLPHLVSAGSDPWSFTTSGGLSQTPETPETPEQVPSRSRVRFLSLFVGGN